MTINFTQTIATDADALFETSPDGTTCCTVCESLNSLARGRRCTVCGSFEADGQPGTRVIARRNDARTLADIEHAYDNEDWCGYGYLARRSQALNSTDPEIPSQPDRVTEADTWLLAEVNRQGWTAEELFNWLNSRTGRFYGDLWFGGTAGTKHPVVEQSRPLVRRVRV